MTLNPLVHMGGMSLLMFAICGIAWGAMPVDPSRFRSYRWGDFLVSAAGPAVNVLLALLSLGGFALWVHVFEGDPSTTAGELIEVILLTGIFLNVVLTLFNLLPIPPLDGSRMLSRAWPWYGNLLNHPQAAMVSMFLFFVVFLGPGSRIITHISRSIHHELTGWVIGGG